MTLLRVKSFEIEWLSADGTYRPSLWVTWIPRWQAVAFFGWQWPPHLIAWGPFGEKLWPRRKRDEAQALASHKGLYDRSKTE